MSSPGHQVFAESTPSLTKALLPSGRPAAPQVLLKSNECVIGANCPTVYRAADGTILLQGYVPSEDQLGQLAPPSGETLIRVPREFLLQMLRELGDKL